MVEGGGFEVGEAGPAVRAPRAVAPGEPLLADTAADGVQSADAHHSSRNGRAHWLPGPAGGVQPMWWVPTSVRTMSGSRTCGHSGWRPARAAEGTRRLAKRCRPQWCTHPLHTSRDQIQRSLHKASRVLGLPRAEGACRRLCAIRWEKSRGMVALTALSTEGLCSSERCHQPLRASFEF